MQPYRTAQSYRVADRQQAYRIADATNPYEHTIASLAARLASAELGIKEPSLRFIQKTIASCADLTTGSLAMGAAKSSGLTIYVRRGLGAKELAETIFHEVRHAQQFQQKSGLSREINERDAQIFEREMMIKIGDPAEYKVLEFLTKALNERGL
jgi:hypothetical protein